METPTIEQLIAEAAQRGALAQQEEEARIAAVLAEEEAKEATRRAQWIASLKGLPEWAAPHLDIAMSHATYGEYYARLDLPSCAPMLINTSRKIRVAERFEIEAPDMDDDYHMSHDYGDPYALTHFDQALYEAAQLYPAWQAAKAECDRLNAEATQPKTPEDQLAPTTLDTAAKLLKRFRDGELLVDYGGEDFELKNSDSRTILIAAQLLAIAQAASRIADALEDR